MSSRIEIGRIAGIPILLDVTFIVLIVLWGHHYFTSGSSLLMSVGLLVVAGLTLSILLHELGHAFAARWYGIPSAYIELNGLGGICSYARPLPSAGTARLVTALAGPAVNLVLWQLFAHLRGYPELVQYRGMAQVLSVLTTANWFLLVFNLMPAFPLDGGHALNAVLSRIMAPEWAIRIVAVLGLAVAAGCALLAVGTSNFWILVLVFFLAAANWEMLQAARRPPGRWN